MDLLGLMSSRRPMAQTFSPSHPSAVGAKHLGDSYSPDRKEPGAAGIISGVMGTSRAFMGRPWPYCIKGNREHRPGNLAVFFVMAMHCLIALGRSVTSERENLLLGFTLAPE